MKILINLSNLKMGGALQVAYSFLIELLFLDVEGFDFYIILSREIENELIGQEDHIFKRMKVYKLKNQPDFGFRGIKARRELGSIEDSINPDCVFSIFGPTYWKPKSIHIAGFAAGWTINPESIAFNVLSSKDRIKKKIQNKIKLWSSVDETDVFIVETDVVKQRLNKYGKVELKNINVVGNTFGNQYNQKLDFTSFKLPPRSSNNEFRLITISANYPHKNLIIIRNVAQLFKENGVEVKFFITISNEDYIHLFKGYEDYIHNLGQVKVKDCPAIYKQCDALFLPTLLESFTASYLEAMVMKLPILTSDLDFARYLCGEAALYFNPLDQQDIVDKIELLKNDKILHKSLVDLGSMKLKDYPTARERADSYISICKKVTKK